MLEGFEESLNNERTKRHSNRFREKREFAFPWTSWGPAFADGSYRTHFLAHPQKCPAAYHLYSTHAIEIDPGRDPKKVLCTESYDRNLPCFCCELLDLCDDDDIWPFLGEDLQDVLRQLRAKRSYLFPVAMCARRIGTGTDGPNWEPCEGAETGILLAISQDTVLKRINTLRKLYPTMSQKGHDGRYVWFTKDGRNYQIDAEPEPAALDNLDLLGEKYPKVREFGFKDKKLSRDRIEAMVRGTWWGRKLNEFIDLDS